MDKETNDYKMIRELLAAALWRPATTSPEPWRHETNAEEREDFRLKADWLLEELEDKGVKIDVPKKAKSMAALKVLMTVPEHLAYTLPGIEF